MELGLLLLPVNCETTSNITDTKRFTEVQYTF
jgi:hypothetical protein